MFPYTKFILEQGGMEMNTFERKIQTRLRLHPEKLLKLLTLPTDETIEALIHYRVFESKNAYLGQLLFSLLPQWEYLACDGSEALGKLIRLIENSRISPIAHEDHILRSNLLRIRILTETSGHFPFSPLYIQENLLDFLTDSEVLADLPLLEVIYFSTEELLPLVSELEQYQISPLSRRYVQNLYHPERQEAVLTALAYLSKNYPLLGTSRQAYALMLSLDEIDQWSKHPFCLRLLANRFWEYRAQQVL